MRRETATFANVWGLTAYAHRIEFHASFHGRWPNNHLLIYKARSFRRQETRSNPNEKISELSPRGSSDTLVYRSLVRAETRQLSAARSPQLSSRNAWSHERLSALKVGRL